VDFLARAGQRYWQVLPIHPVGPGYSPYAGTSAFAGNPMLIGLEQLVEQGLLLPGDVEKVPDTHHVDYERVSAMREAALRKAFARRGRETHADAEEFQAFRASQRFWLEDYALFCAASQHHGGRNWLAWDAALARREPAALARARRTWAEEIQFVEFTQWLFDRQWRELRTYANERDILLIGDVPIFVAHESADVWGHQEVFLLDDTGRPTHVSGVPPDYFSETGQRWGTPLYRWNALAERDYGWWVQRMRGLFARFDLVRLDHFIGFARYWKIPAEAETAVDGKWMKGPRDALFAAIARAMGRGDEDQPLPLIAEDLGCVNRQVTELRDRLRLPGMRVMQFGFAGDGKPDPLHVPHAYPRRCVAYTGTHDSNTLVGWLEEGGDGRGKVDPKKVRALRSALLDYLYGPHTQPATTPIHLAMIRALFASRAGTAIVPIQDWLGLGADARMNVPGRAEGNWTFRLPAKALTPELAETMRDYALTYGRYSSSQTESEPGGQGKSAAP
jgi:4-alpha-glucanotransferase